MSALRAVEVARRDLATLESVVGRARLRRLRDAAHVVKGRLAGRPIVNVNTAEQGGGVAEMLRPLVSYARALGIDVRWLVLEGSSDFFRVTKRLHHALHGSPGDGSSLGEREHAVYERALVEAARELSRNLPREALVILHDPQTAGLASPLHEGGAHVLWRCHIGANKKNALTREGWAFLKRYLKDVPLHVFSRRAFVPAFLKGRARIIQPSIDPLSAKNADLDADTARRILQYTGLLEDDGTTARQPFTVELPLGSVRIARRADVVRAGHPPSPGERVVTQVSRWDPLKDMSGVMHGFVRALDSLSEPYPHLILAGPEVRSVADDPEAPRTFEQVREAFEALPSRARRQIHLVRLPMADIEENALMVNALQHHADVVVQKSLQEGFGLTVTEAMWKGRAVIASKVGGIQDQLRDGKTGVLLEDPTDLATFSRALARLLDQPDLRRELGEHARKRVMRRFLGVRHLLQYAALIERLYASD